MDARKGNKCRLTGANATYRTTLINDPKRHWNRMQIILWIKYLGENMRSEMLNRGIYACLTAQGSRTARRGTRCQPRARDLPEKQNNTCLLYTSDAADE